MKFLERVFRSDQQEKAAARAKEAVRATQQTIDSAKTARTIASHTASRADRLAAAYADADYALLWTRRKKRK